MAEHKRKFDCLLLWKTHRTFCCM